MTLTPQTIAIIKATAPVVAPLAGEITRLFYEKLLSRNRELYMFFNKANQSTTKQPMMLANAVVAYASHIDNLSVLTDPIKVIVNKHCALQVLPEHYQVVHDTLMEAVGEVLGGAVTPEIGAAWSEAVMNLAGILIGEESKCYDEAASRSGGWRGWKKCILSERKLVDSHAELFKFVKADGNQDPIDFTPGQFLTLNADLKDEEGDAVAPRHYTVVNEPGKSYLEINVKEIPFGRLSNWLHKMKVGDTVDLTPPLGNKGKS